MAEMETDDASLIVCFDLSDENFAWRDDTPRSIEVRRSHLSDALIFDLLLARGGAHGPDTLYPPHDVHGLRRLLDAIDNTTYDSLKKDCLVYYLLKWHHDSRETAFAEARCIPPQFVALSDAYWYLDSGVDVPRAVSTLSDARLTLDYTSKILQVISLEEHPGPQILRFVRAAQPLLTEPDDIDLYTLALAESSLVEAFEYERMFPERGEIQARLIKNILTWCLSPAPKPKALPHLLALPLTAHEQHILHTLALSPPVASPSPSAYRSPINPTIPPMSVPILQDLVITRLVHSGQYVLAAKLDKQFAFPPPGLSLSGKAADNWRRAAQERRQTIDEVLSIMPSAERRLLEKDLEKAGVTVDDSDLSMSWEHVRPPPPAPAAGSSQPQGEPMSLSSPARHLDISSSPHLSIAQRSRGPRFGVTTTVVSSGPPVHIHSPSPAKISAAPSSGPSSSFAAARQIFESISASPIVKKAGSSSSVNSSGKGVSASAAPTAAPLRLKSTDPVLSSRISPAMGTPVPPEEIQALLEGSAPSAPAPVASGSISAGPTPAKSKGKGMSLFDTMGSANRAPNAFFQPPTSTNGNGKRPLSALVESLSANHSTQSPPQTYSPSPAEEVEKVEKEKEQPQLLAADEPHLADVSTGSALDVSLMLHQDSEDVDMGGVEDGKIPAPDFLGGGGPDESGEFNFSVFSSKFAKARARSSSPPTQAQNGKPISGVGMGVPTVGAPMKMERTDSMASVHPPGAFFDRPAPIPESLEPLQEQDESMQEDGPQHVSDSRLQRERKARGSQLPKTRSTRAKVTKVEDDEDEEKEKEERVRPPLSRSLPGALEPLEELTELERERERVERAEREAREAQEKAQAQEEALEQPKEKGNEKKPKGKSRSKAKLEPMGTEGEEDEIPSLPPQTPAAKRRAGRKSTRTGTASAASLAAEEISRPARRSTRLNLKEVVESESEKESVSPVKPNRRGSGVAVSGGSGGASSTVGGGTGRTTRSRKQKS